MKPMLQKSLLTIAIVSATPAMAGGLWITEYGQPTQGRAGAGETTGNGDATDAFLNPSAMPNPARKTGTTATFLPAMTGARIGVSGVSMSSVVMGRSRVIS